MNQTTSSLALTKGMIVMSGEGAQPSVTEGPKEPGAKTFDDVLANYATLEKAVHDAIAKLQTAASSQPSKWDRFNQFTSSGLFFMIVGAGFLLVAAITLNTAHASFSFVLVVIGVAVLLFGTGTQGVGEAQATGYKVAIAGGAGVIAFCVGWGIIHYADSIKTVFQIEKKYIRVVLVGVDGSSNLSSYVPVVPSTLLTDSNVALPCLVNIIERLSGSVELPVFNLRYALNF
jgi:hypothetical protein